MRDTVSNEQGRATVAGGTFWINEIKQLNVVAPKHHMQSAAAQGQRRLRVWVQERASGVVADKETGLQGASNHKVKQRVPIFGESSLHHDAHKKRHAVADDHHFGADLPKVLQVRNDVLGRIYVTLRVSPNAEEKSTFGLTKPA